MKGLLHLATAVWAIVLTVQIGGWSSAHAVPLRGGDLSLALPPDPNWRAVHVLVDDCACSRSVADYLVRRGPQPGWREEVWILNAADHLAVPNFPSSRLSATRAQATGITGGPRLLVFAPNGSLAWSGGYSPRKPRGIAEWQDLSIMRAVADGHSPAAIPVFGCPRTSPDREEPQ